jgi:hypothetical protein
VHFESILPGQIIKFVDNDGQGNSLNRTTSTIKKGDINYSTLTATQQIDLLSVNK